MRPSRISSEAPEVVPQHHQHQQSGDSANFFLGNDLGGNGLGFVKPGEERQSQYKQVDERETETTNYPPTVGSPSPLLVYEPVIFGDSSRETKKQHRRKILTTVVLMFVAFIVGGGIGGGVGGGLVLQEKSRALVQATVTATTTATPSATGCATTSWNDMSGCPNIDHYTQNATGSGVGYRVLCGVTIDSEAGQNIEAFHSVQTSFGDCLNACATYTNNSCVAVTWYQFWPADPSWNSVCFLKNGTGVNTTLPANQKFGYATSGILASLVVG